MMNSSYMIQQNSMKYGGKQSEFIEKTEEVIQWGLKVVITDKKSDDYRDLFFTLLEGFAKARHDLAVSHKTKDAKYFGRSRMHSMGDVEMTGLGNEYKEYNKRLLSLFSTILKGHIPLKGEPVKKKVHVEEKHLGRKSSLEIELLSESEATKRRWLIPQTEMLRDLQVANQHLPTVVGLEIVDENNYPPTNEEKQVLESFNHHMQVMKQKNPELYTRSKIWYVLNKLSLAIPRPVPVYDNLDNCIGLKGDINNIRSIYAIGTVRIQIDDKMYALSKYITWACQDHTTDPLERMQHTTAVILHQDRFLLNETLNEIAKIFKQAMLWDRSQDLQALKNDVGLIRYLFAHAMPFSRGSATIAEWMEKLIYRAHNFDCLHVANTMGDMEAFVAPLWSTFQNNAYNATFSLVDRG